MLRSLLIKNYALIAEITVQFDRGLNIITGETGAGKSIILDAFSLLIGERTSPDVIRSGATKAVVEAEFQIEGNPKLERFLRQHELDSEGNTMSVRREVQSKGSSRGFINDTPASTQLLKELGNYVVDLHGQHEHQSLLRSEGHIVLLDEFAGIEKDVQRFAEKRAEFISILRELKELRSQELRLREEREFFEFQLTELTQVDAQPGEDVAIDEELKKLENAEELTEAAERIHALLYEEGSAYERLAEVRQLLERVSKYDSTLGDQRAEVASAIAAVEELARFFSRYAEHVQHEPARLNELRERMQLLTRIKKKYGGSLDAVIARRRDLEEKLQPEESVEEKIGSLVSKLSVLRSEATTLAEQLTASRTRAARKLEQGIVEALKELGIEKPTFQVRFETRLMAGGAEEEAVVRLHRQSYHTDLRGMDLVEFYLSTNPGEDPKPLTKVASGGEVSRIMLALKTIFAKVDRMPLMVFDEIDVGVSGRIAQRVGQSMKRLAVKHQIITITHLAQIAAFADTHFIVEKSSTRGVTQSSLRKLDRDEHVQEVARLISGADVSASSLQTAQELIESTRIAPAKKSSSATTV